MSDLNVTLSELTYDLHSHSLCSLACSQYTTEESQRQHGHLLSRQEGGGRMQTPPSVQSCRSGTSALLPAEPQKGQQ